MNNSDILRQLFTSEVNRIEQSITYAVEIIDSNFLYIPHDFFKKYNVRRLSLVHVSLISLSDTDTAFEGLEKSLNFLHMQDGILFRDLEWYQLRNLSELKDLSLINIGLEYIDNDISFISNLNLTEISLLKNKISFISDRAFAPFVNLQALSLGHNMISELKRSMLPNPGKHLKKFDLRFEKDYGQL
nr:uncharacterized protein LOC122270344 [Parasteatoda tepidariorum]